MKLDLKELLSKFLTLKMNVGVFNIPNTTATSDKTIATYQFTSNTGKIVLIGSSALYTSRYTSHIALFVNGVEKARALTNAQPPANTNQADRVMLLGYADVPINQSCTITVQLGGQDSGTTATIPAYHTSGVLVLDIL